MKTTNVKAKAFQTPGVPATNLGKPKGAETGFNKSGTVRKIKPVVAPAETKNDVLAENDETEEQDIEYMPPKPKGKVSLHIHTRCF